MIAANMANMRQGERTDVEPSANLQKVSQSEAAELLQVSPRSVATAAKVERETLGDDQSENGRFLYGDFDRLNGRFFLCGVSPENVLFICER